MTSEKIIINNEDQAIELLTKLVDGFEFDETLNIEFDSWPCFTIRIKGADFDGTIPTRVMPTLLDLQREVHRVYCVATYGEENLRKLTKKDKEQLELVVKVDKGSSIYETLLKEPIVKILQDAASKMSPEQLTAVLIIFGLSVTSVLFWKMYLAKESKDKELDHTVELSKLEKEKMEVVQRAMQKFPESQASSENMNNVRNDLLTKLQTNDNLEISTQTNEKEEYPEPVNITGEQAEQITYAPREKAVEKMIDGEYFLRSADFSKTEGVRAVLEEISGQYIFRADIPLGVLGYEQMESLKNNSWNKKSLVMSLLVKELHNRYTSAKVISVKQ